MKKLFATILCLIFAFFAFGCKPTEDSGVTEKAEYTLVMPDGAPVLAAINLIKNYQEIDGHKMNYRIVSANFIANEYTKNGDLAVMPTNAAATLYNKGVDVKLVSVNVFGVMYMIGQNGLASLSDLKGKVIYSIGEGNTPDLLMKYFLSLAGVKYGNSDAVVDGQASFVYVNEGPEVIQAMAAWQNGKSTKRVDYGVLGQPAVTNALNKLKDTSVVFDFQSEWKKLNGGDYPQAGVVAKNKVATDSSFVSELRKALAENYDYVCKNPEAVTEVLTANNSTLKSLTFDKKLIDACNVGYTSATQAKESLENYFTKATLHDPASVKFFGGKLPGADFYVG